MLFATCSLLGTTEDPATVLRPENTSTPPVSYDYDRLVREGLQQAPAVKGPNEAGGGEGNDEEGATWKHSWGGGDLDDDFIEKDEDEGWADIGTRIKVAGVPQASEVQVSVETDCAKFVKYLVPPREYRFRRQWWTAHWWD